MTNKVLPRETLVQNYRLIWLDTNIDQTNSIDLLKSLVNTIEIFNDIDQCIDCLTEIFLENVFLILSKDWIESIRFLLDDISQVNEIFIIGDVDEQSTNDWWKIKGSYSDMNSLYISLKESIDRLDRNTIPISLISLDHSLDFNLNKFDRTFIYSHMIKEILFQMEYHEQSVKEFADYCRKIFGENYSIMEKINKFEDEYRQRTPIGWYLAENFIFSMLNRALRTQEINSIVKMGFLISGIHQQIVKLHSIQFSNEQNSLIVYRGQSLSKDQWNQLQECQGGFISFNHFLSTTEDRQLAFTFADNRRMNLDSIGVIFQINVNTHTPTIPYARIDDNHQVLFSMNSIYHIDQMKTSEENEQIWIVQLRIINENEPLLKVLTKRIRQETQDATGWNRLGQLALKLEHFNKAEEVYTVLLKCTSDNSEKATLFNHLGNVMQKQGNYVSAIIYYENELRILNRIEPKSFLKIIDGYNNLGSMFLELEQYSLALSYFEMMLLIQSTIFPEDHPAPAASHTRIGHVYNKVNEHSKALSSYKKTLDVFQRILPPNHPDLAASHNLIADMYNKMNEYSQAFQHYQKALEIKHQMASRQQSDSTRSSAREGTLDSALLDVFKAAADIETAATMLKKGQPSKNSELAMYYNDVALLYNRVGKHSEALLTCEKALAICQSDLPANHPALLVSYHNLGEIYQSMQEYSQAFVFYQKALEIADKNTAIKPEEVASIYTSIGQLYMKTFDYSQALVFYKKALEIEEKNLPSNHPALGLTFKDISEAYKSMGDLESAMEFRIRCMAIVESNLR